MIFRKLRAIQKNQSGFSLLELIVVVAIMSFIGTGATMATIQMTNQGERNSDYTAASRHAMNAIYWISRDTQMAQHVEPDGGASGFPLTLRWTEWDNSEYQVVYSLQDGELRRSYSGGGGSQTLVAEYINGAPENTSCELNEVVLTLTVTATVGNGSNAVSVTKVREITPRPGL